MGFSTEELSIGCCPLTAAQTTWFLGATEAVEGIIVAETRACWRWFRSNLGFLIFLSAQIDLTVSTTVKT